MESTNSKQTSLVDSSESQAIENKLQELRSISDQKEAIEQKLSLLGELAAIKILNTQTFKIRPHTGTIDFQIEVPEEIVTDIITKVIEYRTKEREALIERAKHLMK